MEWDHDIDLSKRKLTSQLIVRRVLARGWKICAFKTNLAVFLIYIPGRDKPIKIMSASPPQMSYAAVKIAKDKFITNQILNQENIPTPKEILINSSDYNEIEIETFIKSCGVVVLKPLDASHGKGITMNITSLDDFRKAIDEVRLYTEKNSVVLQEEVQGIDVRVLCINYKYISSISRIPASVVGDGKHNIRELIEITNKSEDRGNNYQSKLNIIPIDKVEKYLKPDQLENIPANGEDFQVIGVSNIGMGGIRKNVGELIPQSLIDIAIKVSEIIELPVCGVDFMIKHLPNPNSTLAELDPKLIEVNECPMLTVYEDVESVEEERVIDNYLDFVASY